MATAFASIDALVSNAALFSVGNASCEQPMRTHVDGTRNVYLALAGAGVRRAIQNTCARR
jgi:nucleoside-diphosphate-sugar epimerase